MKILIAYIPVLHKGYEDFFLRHKDAEEVFILGSEIISQFEWLKKDLRCLDPERVAQAIFSWGIFPKVSILSTEIINSFGGHISVVMPDETECRFLWENTNLKKISVSFESVNLRYDKKKTESTDGIDATEINSQEVLGLMGIANLTRVNSPDWWIQVGALLVRDGNVIIAGFNEHQPSSREALFMGDPRSNYKRGLNIELSLADHAEAVVIGEAAREGIVVSGCDLYVTTFPCPPCSRLVKRTGIKRVFFQNGYAVLDGDKMLRDVGIELYRVIK